jgi:PAS domain S-box-containing protein
MKPSSPQSSPTTRDADSGRPALERDARLAELTLENRRLVSLTSLGRAVSGSLEVEEVIADIVAGVLDVTRAQLVEVWVREAEGDPFRVYGANGAQESAFFSQSLLDAKSSIIGEATKTGEAVFRPITRSQRSFRPELYDQGYQTFCAAPLSTRGNLIGVLLAAYKVPPESVIAYERSFIQSIASFGAPMVENALLYRQVRERGEEASALLEVGKSVVRSLRLDEVLDTIVRATASLLRADKAHLFVLDRTTNRLRHGASYGYESNVLETVAIPLGRGHIGRTADRGETLVFQDLSQDAVVLHDIVDPEHVRSCAHVPIQIAGEIYGVLSVNYTAPYAVPPRALPLLQGMADQAAIAIHNAELYRQSAEERNALDSIFQSMGEGIYTVDRDLRVVRANDKAGALAGSSAREMVGLLCRQRLPFVDKAGRPLCDAGCPARRAIETGKTVQPEEVFLPQPNGKLLPVDLSAGPLYDQDGRVIGAVEVVQDVSHRHAAEALREDIISLVSHELRTPLGHIKGYASTLLQTDVEWEEEVRREFLQGVVQETTRMSRLITDILELSRLETGGQAGKDRRPVPVAAPVRAGVAEANTFTSSHRVRVSLPKRLPPVLADPSQIEHVISNLVENASKYSLPGTQITVGAKAQPTEVVISVSDQGYGIPADKLEAIFDKFVRLPSPDGKPIPGTGLGLPLCKTIVEGHGGRIWAESIPGQGSRFSFTLPRADLSQ